MRDRRKTEEEGKGVKEKGEGQGFGKDGEGKGVEGDSVNFLTPTVFKTQLRPWYFISFATSE
jgi:hypothetical protein